MKILDTDILISFLNNKEKAVEKINVIKKTEEIVTTVFNEQEVFYGVSKAEDTEKVKTTKEFFDSIIVLNYERKRINSTIKIQIELEKKGLPIGTLDELIGGICLAHNATFVTRNVEHFSRIPSLKVEKW